VKIRYLLKWLKANETSAETTTNAINRIGTES